MKLSSDPEASSILATRAKDMFLFLQHALGRAGRSGHDANRWWKCGCVKLSEDEEAVQRGQLSSSLLTRATRVLFGLFCRRLVLVLWLQELGEVRWTLLCSGTPTLQPSPNCIAISDCHSKTTCE